MGSNEFSSMQQEKRSPTHIIVHRGAIVYSFAPTVTLLVGVEVKIWLIPNDGEIGVFVLYLGVYLAFQGQSTACRVVERRCC